MSRQRGILIGQRFRAYGTKFPTWEVTGFFTFDDEPFDHVRLLRVGTQRDYKTVSAAALGNRKIYERVSGEG